MDILLGSEYLCSLILSYNDPQTLYCVCQRGMKKPAHIFDEYLQYISMQELEKVVVVSHKWLLCIYLPRMPRLTFIWFKRYGRVFTKLNTHHHKPMRKHKSNGWHWTKVFIKVILQHMKVSFTNFYNYFLSINCNYNSINLKPHCFTL